MRHILAACVLALAPAMASADGFYNRDVGDGGAPAACMARARQAIEAYARRIGMPNTTVYHGSRTVAAYGLQPGNVNVQIACPYRSDRAEIVLVTAHSTGTEQDRITAVEGVSAIWDTIGQGGVTPGK